MLPHKNSTESPIGEKNFSLLEQGDVLQTRKYCHNYLYALAGGLNQNKTDMQFSFQDPFAKINVPAILTVILKDCPPGLVLDKFKEKCVCHNKYKSYNILCLANNYTVVIPPLTWSGLYKGKVFVQKKCQYCKNVMVTQHTDNPRNTLCTVHKSGVSCGQCIEGYSLMLGRSECGKCPRSPLVGAALIMAFSCAGVILVVLLLMLDLTISIGAINGLIFYSNIVYLHRDIFFMGSSSTIKFLFTYQAWMNLDFGITMCFFDGYTTYVSTWMQFVFPLFIWFLVLAIILASSYSRNLAKITTVRVLATLLVLSYAKLLNTSIEALSSVKLFSLDGDIINTWKQDGHVHYLGRSHTPLFLMGLLILIAYIIPFTLLILLGPLLQAKSRYTIFKWINKFKPFLDAFYGSYIYTIRYRYWPGLLLLTRVVVIIILVFYPQDDYNFTDDHPVKLMAILIMVLAVVAHLQSLVSNW